MKLPTAGLIVPALLVLPTFVNPLPINTQTMDLSTVPKIEGGESAVRTDIFSRGNIELGEDLLAGRSPTVGRWAAEKVATFIAKAASSTRSNPSGLSTTTTRTELKFNVKGKLPDGIEGGISLTRTKETYRTPIEATPNPSQGASSEGASEAAPKPKV